MSYEIAQQRIAAARRTASPRLNLSNLGLTELPPELWALNQLRVLWLNENQLSGLPPELGALNQLVRLRLNQNQLAALPPAIGELTGLRELWLHDNQLEQVPAEFWQLTELRTLVLNGNRLTEVPAAIAHLRELRILGFGSWIRLRGKSFYSDAGNQLTALPVELAQLSNLQSLSLSNNQLTALPVELAQLSNLQSLSLFNNQLAALPVELAQLSNLQSLSLFNNQLTALPVELAQLSNLQELSLNNNQLTTVLVELAQLSKLESLDLSNNQLTTVPVELAQLSKLESLNLSNNQLTTVPVELAQLSELKSLNLSNNQLATVPVELAQLSELESLNLSNNQLATVPAVLAQLSNLQYLYLSNNQLATVPAVLAQLSNLQYLNLSNNQLATVPTELAELGNLRMLILSNNQLASVPAELAQSKMSTLYLDGNQLTGVPAELAQLSNLTGLNLSNNQLTAVPIEFAQLSNLWWLYLHNNQLTTVPIELAQSSQRLQLTGNPLRYPPEIVEGGDIEICAYLRALDGAKREWVSKMVVVGQGGVGKTSLLRALRNEPFDEDEGTTHGIEIKELKLEHPQQPGVTMQLATWDFAGQEIAHATHQFFLTNRSLYLLAWNARHGYEQGKLYYWLDTIKLRAPNSPIILMAAHTDEREADLPLAELQKAYPQVIAHVEISNKTGAGIERLRELIRQTAADLPLMGEAWPVAWAAVRHAIRALAEKHNHITPNELAALLNEHQITGTQARVLTKWLHELGEILFFQDINDLNDTVILNSHWVTEAIGHVLASNEVVEQLGIFTREHMNQLWKELPPAMREHFLRLMEQFDLSYRILEDKDKSLVIERVPFDPPTYQTRWAAHQEHAPCREIKMRFVLDATMPAGIPTWFIARSHRFSLRTHWRHGALFGDDVKTPTHLGLVQALPHERYVMLTVRGPAPQNFFALLRDGLEVTFNRFPGLSLTRKVPCCGHDGQPCTHEFDLKQLEKALSLTPPRTDIQCPEAFEDVPIAKLLFGIDRDTTEQRLEELLSYAQRADEKLSKVSYELQQLAEYSQREFTKLFNAEQHKEESRCPYVFILRSGSYDNDLLGLFSGTSVRGGVVDELRDRLWKRKVELQLYCQMPGYWHPCGYERGKDDPATGLYQIELNGELAQLMATHLPTMVKWLKFARPLLTLTTALTTGVPLPLPDVKKLEEHLKQDQERMEKLAAQVQESTETKLANRLGEAGQPAEASGAFLRNLRRLLEEKDNPQTWGGLKRILTKEGHHLWLCPHHLAEYKQ